MDAGSGGAAVLHPEGLVGGEADGVPLRQAVALSFSEDLRRTGEDGEESGTARRPGLRGEGAADEHVHVEALLAEVVIV